MIWIFATSVLVCISILWARWIELRWSDHRSLLRGRKIDVEWKMICHQSDDHCDECMARLERCPHGNEDLCMECGGHLDECPHQNSIRRQHKRPTCHVCGDPDREFTRFGRVSWWPGEQKWICDACVSGRDKVPSPVNPFDDYRSLREDRTVDSEFMHVKKQLLCGDVEHDWKK